MNGDSKLVDTLVGRYSGEDNSEAKMLALMGCYKKFEELGCTHYTSALSFFFMSTAIIMSYEDDDDEIHRFAEHLVDTGEILMRKVAERRKKREKN